MIKKIAFQSTVIFSLAAIAFSIFVFWDRRDSAVKKSEQEEQVVFQKQDGKVLGEEGNQPASQMFASGNFRAPQISFGGDAIAILSGEQAEAPEISDLKSELIMTKSDQRVKFVLNWTTNKPCVSTIDFKKGGEERGKTISEDGYGYVHGAALAPLSFSTSYSYVVSVKDRWGNVAQSDKLSFYTGAPNVSIFDLLGDAFKDMFGR